MAELVSSILPTVRKKRDKTKRPDTGYAFMSMFFQLLSMVIEMSIAKDPVEYHTHQLLF
jgi:hypothetical protein